MGFELSIRPVVLLSLYILCSCAKEVTSTSKNGLPTLPKIDIFGQRIDSIDIRNRYIYIQFFKTITPQVADGIRTICERSESSGKIAPIFVIPEVMALKVNNYRYRYAFFVANERTILRDELNAPPCCDSFYIFNQHQKLMYAGTVNVSCQTEVLPFLNEIISEANLQYFDSAFKRRKIEDWELGTNLTRELNSSNAGNRYHFVALLSNICTTCPIAAIMSHIDQYYSAIPPSISFTLFLGDEYRSTDIETIKSLLGIKMPVRMLDAESNQRWAALKNALPNIFENVLVIMSKDGMVISTYENEDGGQGFYKILSRLCTE